MECLAPESQTLICQQLRRAPPVIPASLPCSAGPLQAKPPAGNQLGKKAEQPGRRLAKV